jgi:GMP synthase-like glutamine amidotransferase
VRLLVFQHIDIEHPAIFRDFLAEDGVAWDAVELDAGEPIPPLDGYDSLWVMGGPMDVWQEDEHPWLVPEKAAVREAVVERRMPYFGVCLGHQLLGEALGGTVGPMAAPEIGILDVDLTSAGAADPLFAGLGPTIKSLQWHGAAVSTLPDGGVALAQSPVCPVQALRVGDRAWGIQFHCEVTAATVPEWGVVPAYRQALEDSLGTDALSRFQADAAAALPGFNASARKLYDNFMAQARSLTA